jgi:hypothetical protein
LKELKESNPVQVAEYVTAKGLDSEPAFSWWVPYTLKKMKVIISAIKSCKQTSHKYGVEIPRSIDHARELDKNNNNRLWMAANEKEMSNVSIAFEILEDGEHAPTNYKKSSGHLIWDVKMDFTRKARWVKGWT